ncbi:MAG: FGGY family carbohydrate kinase [Actinomycetota bacterium]|nr:FGGY family carbohydrate kinase [Actinomycetota bacterium]
MTTSVLLGVDVGTTDIKVLATTTAGEEICLDTAPTRWHGYPDGRTELAPDGLSDDIIALLATVAQAAAERLGAVRVAGIGITGMAEAGVLRRRDGTSSYPIIAWFDPRGQHEMAALPPALRAEFPGRTGLPVSGLATLAKLLWMRDHGIELTGCNWLGVPEFVAARLGGEPVAELSLVSRTGLLDQHTLEPLAAALELLAVGPELLPPFVAGGTPLGTAAGDQIPKILRGAVITVAGHDHPVAAVGAGAAGSEDVFDSFGTAEALVRSTTGDVTVAERARLAEIDINTVQHALAGRQMLLGGTKAGLLQRRALGLLGVHGRDGRDRLDAAACALLDRIGDDVTPEGIVVHGAAMNDGALHLRLDIHDVDPAAVWLAIVHHGVDIVIEMLAEMATIAGASGRAVVAGGWTRMTSVKRIKSARQPALRFSPRRQAGAFGAALFAAHAIGTADRARSAGHHDSRVLDAMTGPDEQFIHTFTNHQAGTSARPPRGALTA